jgi:hypothetical protein
MVVPMIAKGTAMAVADVQRIWCSSSPKSSDESMTFENGSEGITIDETTSISVIATIQRERWK